MPAPYCLYDNQGLNKFPPTGNCFGYSQNEWMTFQVRIKTGPLIGDEFTNSLVELWVARDNQPSVKVISRTINLSAGTPGTDQKFGKIWLLPYHTGKDPSQSHLTGYVWYDELIISTAKIADPTTGGGTPTPTPTPTVTPTPTPVPTPTPSTKFISGDRVQVILGTLNVRSCAGTACTLLGSQAVGIQGTIISGGISADGFFWWNVNYDSGVDGWSAENWLILVNTSTSEIIGVESLNSNYLTATASDAIQIENLKARLSALQRQLDGLLGR